MKSRQDRVSKSLEGIVKLFESGQASEAMAVRSLPPPDTPAAKWSLNNNLLLWIAGTGDARGYRQWREAGRHVRKGARAIHILAPTFQVKEEETDTGDTERKQVLRGFRAVPVFRFEDTDGDPLQHDLEPPQPPPLMDVAEAWGLTVRYVGNSGPYLGYYRHHKERPSEITLATHEEQVFFHELAHAAQYRVWPDIKPQQKLRKEIAAELAACVLARLYGRRSANEGFSYQYVKSYCDEHQKPLNKCLWSLVADTEKVLKAILETHATAIAS
jgi:antirestriction protein ArdC